LLALLDDALFQFAEFNDQFIAGAGALELSVLSVLAHFSGYFLQSSFTIVVFSHAFVFELPSNRVSSPEIVVFQALFTVAPFNVAAFVVNHSIATIDKVIRTLLIFFICML
jgi:hypothetical protein